MLLRAGSSTHPAGAIARRGDTYVGHADAGLQNRWQCGVGGSKCSGMKARLFAIPIHDRRVISHAMPMNRIVMPHDRLPVRWTRVAAVVQAMPAPDEIAEQKP